MRDLKPFPYQTRGVEFLRNTPCAMINGAIGSGKTVISLLFITEMIYGGIVDKVLIIAPPGVATSTFPKEIEKWRQFRHLKYRVLHGPKKWDKLREDANIYLCSYDSDTLVRIFTDEHGLIPDMIVCDESHNIKSQSTKRWKILAEVMPHIRFKIMMTGTIMGNSLCDLWGQFRLLDNGRRLFRSESAFHNYWFFRQGTGVHGKWIPRKSAREEIVKQIHDITYEIDVSQVKLPKLREEVVEIQLPKNVMKAYEVLETKAFLTLGEQKSVTAFNLGAILQKTQQMAAGFIYIDNADGTRETVFIHDEKIKALKEEIRQAGGEGVMIVANYKEEFIRLAKEFPGIGIINGSTSKGKARRLEDAWNRGDLKLLAIHPKSAGEGLNLQYGGRRQIWTSREWSVIKHRQTLGRSHRQGQKKEVIVKYLIVKDTIDEIMHLANSSHLTEAKKVMELLRSYRASKNFHRDAAQPIKKSES